MKCPSNIKLPGSKALMLFYKELVKVNWSAEAGYLSSWILQDKQIQSMSALLLEPKGTSKRCQVL